VIDRKRLFKVSAGAYTGHGTPSRSPAE
jgi:hypothetical protein